MDIITTNNDLVLRLINDILDLSKIESGSMEIKKEKFDIVETLNTIYLNFKDRCSEKNILMQKDCELDKLVIYQDHNRLSQIFVNFTTNAIKYSINGEITIGLEYINNGVKIYVKDSGIGIPDSKKDRKSVV